MVSYISAKSGTHICFLASMLADIFKLNCVPDFLKKYFHKYFGLAPHCSPVKAH